MRDISPPPEDKAASASRNSPPGRGESQSDSSGLVVEQTAPAHRTPSPLADLPAEEMESPGLPELNPIIHGKLRLAVLSLLSGVDQAEFTWLRLKTASTDGNLGAHLLKLEEAGYIAAEKKFVQRKPVSLYRITESGREELTAYIRALKVLLGGALQPG